MPDLSRFQIDHDGRPHDLRVGRHPSESLAWLVTRVLAWTLHYEDGLTFSKKGVCQGDWPAISTVGDNGRPRTWIDIGLPSPKRLRRALGLAQRAILYSSAPTATLHRLLTRCADGRLALWQVDGRFLLALAAGLDGRAAHWRLTVEADDQIVVNGLAGRRSRLAPP